MKAFENLTLSIVYCCDVGPYSIDPTPLLRTHKGLLPILADYSLGTQGEALFVGKYSTSGAFAHAYPYPLGVPLRSQIPGIKEFE